MFLIDKTFTDSVNLIQKYVVPLLEKRLPQYAASETFFKRIDSLGLRSDKLYFGGMVHDPERSEFLMDDIESDPPKEVIECGAGNSTSWLLALSLKHGFGFTSLENHPDTIRYIQYLLDDTHLEQHFHTDVCGFTRFRKPDGSSYWWYDVDIGKLNKKFDFVFVDGPMSSLVGRSGALYRLWNYLQPGARIFVDDANRPHERQMIIDWKRDFPNIKIEYPTHTLARIVKYE